ncbi:50S ribosomal protein L23 [Patescibacteria group bacterium]|nr:50S ribosomal protein L23 [Patescibacteria group bacterium]
MGLLDRLKRKKTSLAEPSKDEAKPKAANKKSAPKEVEQQAVVTADGKLMATTKKSDKKAPKAKPKKDDTGDAYKVLIKPLVTEKGSSLRMNGQYIFEVSTQTNKIEIRKAFQKVYDIVPVKVNIINVQGKYVRYGKTDGSTKRWKKAVITLPAGKKIEIQEGL